MPTSTTELLRVAAGVPEILVDRQLGHSSPAGEAALRAAWSAVGRSRYTDMGFLTADARRSAEAVRAVLDRAKLSLHEQVEVPKVAALAAGPPDHTSIAPEGALK